MPLIWNIFQVRECKLLKYKGSISLLQMYLGSKFNKLESKYGARPFWGKKVTH